MIALDEIILKRINYRDSFRAQYYITDLQNVTRQLVNHLEKFECVNINEIILDLLQHLANELDDIILPVVIYEIHAHKEDVNCFSPQERYQNFFIDISTKSWTATAREIIRKYSFTFDIIKTYCYSTIENIKTCLTRLVVDKDIIRDTFSFDPDPKNIRQINASGSDRHRGGQTVLILIFQDQRKLVYKNCDSIVDKALQKFIALLDLSSPYDIRTAIFITKNDYTWYEYVEHKCCNSMNEIMNYHKRAGSLLAVLDTLNFCDGHCENFIASGEYPYLIDCETLFQNFSNQDLDVETDSSIMERSILFTGLIDKPDQKESSSAFQSAGYIQQFFQPVIYNDHTNEIKLRFNWLENDEVTDELTTGPKYDNLKNAPCFEKQAYTLESFLDEFIEGYRYTYQHIKTHSIALLDIQNPFWHEIKKISSAREIIRPTAFYSMLVRRLQQPMFAANREIARQYVLDYLQSHSSDQNLKLTEYEIEELLQLNIPYFTHQPNDKDLLTGDNIRYVNYFSCSAMEQIRSNIEHASDNYCDRQISMLRNVVKTTPAIIAHCDCYVCSSN